jgi:apolipoprotein N-acyltransferase
LAQVRMFISFFLIPEAAAWCVLFLFSAKATIANGRLVLAHPGRQIELALADIADVQLWKLPLPSRGLSLRLASGQRWRYELALRNPQALISALAAGGVALRDPGSVRAPLQTYAQAGMAVRGSRLDHPLVKYLLLPLALAIPAFHLHQHISYGAALGEYYSFGLRAYLSAFALWWAAWSIGVVLCEALLRAAIEAGTLLAALVRPARTIAIRAVLERGGHAALFLGLPGWLLMTVYGR